MTKYEKQLQSKNHSLKLIGEAFWKNIFEITGNEQSDEKDRTYQVDFADCVVEYKFWFTFDDTNYCSQMVLDLSIYEIVVQFPNSERYLTTKEVETIEQTLNF